MHALILNFDFTVAHSTNHTHMSRYTCADSRRACISKFLMRASPSAATAAATAALAIFSRSVARRSASFASAIAATSSDSSTAAVELLFWLFMTVVVVMVVVVVVVAAEKCSAELVPNVRVPAGQLSPESAENLLRSAAKSFPEVSPLFTRTLVAESAGIMADNAAGPIAPA